MPATPASSSAMLAGSGTSTAMGATGKVTIPGTAGTAGVTGIAGVAGMPGPFGTAGVAGTAGMAGVAGLIGAICAGIGSTMRSGRAICTISAWAVPAAAQTRAKTMWRTCMGDSCYCDDNECSDTAVESGKYLQSNIMLTRCQYAPVSIDSCS
ncbi:collagen-like protein [Massilia sp. Dwa41.01b]|nr:collagen-like protein [Massilia sp. Dwa41.01b]